MSCGRWFEWSVVVSLCLLVVSGGCSSSDPREDRGVRSGPGTSDSAEGADGADGADGDRASGQVPGFGGGPGTTPPHRAMTPSVPVPPTIDPNASAWSEDATPDSGLDQGTIDTLKAGGDDCSIGVTYPYNGTMFPGALAPPTIMWEGGGESAYVRFRYDQSDLTNYEFATALGNAGELQIPRDAWNEITRRTNGAALEVTLSVMVSGTVSTCELNWRVAPGNMNGALYYNTYQAPPPGVEGQGAIMRLPLGADYEIYKQFEGLTVGPFGPCYSCHSVSADGSTMVASYHDYFGKFFETEKYDVAQDLQPAASGTIHNATFGALTPDGSRILAMGNPECTQNSDTFPRKPNNFPLVDGADVARMLDTASGTDTGATGLDPDHYMWMAQFSPDGDQVVFNHSKPDGSGTDRTQLAIMDYDYASNAFSNLRVIVDALALGAPTGSRPYAPEPAGAGLVPVGYAPEGRNMCEAPGDLVDEFRQVGGLSDGLCEGPCYPAWPFFTPDGRGVVFSMISSPDFTQAFPGREEPSDSELWYADTETLEVVRLDNLNRGLKDIDALSNYYPTVMPVAVGGYYWVFWTAVRDYGNRLEGRDTTAEPDAYEDAIKKRIWLAAIKSRAPAGGEVMASPGPLTDPSFPGFYMPGQSESGNVRAFATLNPCLPELAECSSGLDCCCGFCTIEEGAAVGQCCKEVTTCSRTNERCSTDADCCPPSGPDEPQNICLGGFCGFVTVL